MTEEATRATSDPGPTGSEVAVRFETLMAEVSSRLMTLPPGEPGRELVKVLEQIGRFMGADRAFVFLLSRDEAHPHHHVAHIWTADRIPDDPVVVGTVVQKDFPWVGSKMSRNEDVVVDLVSDLPLEADRERAYCEGVGIQSFLMCPMYSVDAVVGSLGLDAIRKPRTWTERDRRRLRLFGEVVAGWLLRQRFREELDDRMKEVRALKDRLEVENQYLRREALQGLDETEVVAESPGMKKVLEQAANVASTDSTVLILGETGTGKELLARAIHGMSGRRERPLVAVNCAALSPSLVENELFGRDKGAYTGAVGKQIGRFELADGSTLFLDEVGELSLEVQSKLLRVLQSGEFERLGSPKTIKVDVRLVAATNRDLEKAMADGSFREDLFYRLNVFPMTLPPLRQRRDDIPLLVWALVRELESKMARRIEAIPDETMEALQGHDWPGNVRELRNVLERAVILNRDGRLHVDLPSSAPHRSTTTATTRTVEQVERDHILSVLEGVGWRIRGNDGAAHLLGLKPTTLESRMKKLGIRRL